jgi:histidyl-tRNA synthetase
MLEIYIFGAKLKKLKPSIPKGTRDFSQKQVLKRNYIFNSLKEIFQLHAYFPLETPTMENLSTLTGKYGEEGDQLIFKVLNSGNYLENISEEEFKNPKKLSGKICEKALRYDLTIPFARYIVQNRNEISFPFKRYQIQPVWRADRPQKGRYREFYQCDIDVIGSNSLTNELEIIEVINEVFQKLNLNVVTKINNRKLLFEIAQWIGCENDFIGFTVVLDKLDKIGLEKVIEELSLKNFNQEMLDKTQKVLSISGDTSKKIKELKELVFKHSNSSEGLNEIEFLLNNHTANTINSLELDLTLARGLNYYTGCIFEIKTAIGEFNSSIGGGGRYDNLTGMFGLNDVSGVGISFGADRIYDVLEEQNLFPTQTKPPFVLVIHSGEKEQKRGFEIAAKIRQLNFPIMVYPDVAKFKKQLDYANQTEAAYAVIIGEDELRGNKFSLKNLTTGEQQKLNEMELIHFFTK